MMAISASVILGLGLIPPYFELAKRNGRVIGIGTSCGVGLCETRVSVLRLCVHIDFIFLTVDWLGAFFSLMALGTSPSESPIVDGN
jgi:hypothetical protein